MEEKKHTEKTAEIHHVKKRKISIWKIISAIFFVLLIASIFTYGFRGATASKGIVSKEQVGKKTLDFLNNQLLQGRATATLNSIVDENQMYKVTVTVNGQQGSLYVSRDGKFLFPQAIDLDLTLPPIPNLPEENASLRQNSSSQEVAQTAQTTTQEISNKQSTPSSPPTVPNY